MKHVIGRDSFDDWAYDEAAQNVPDLSSLEEDFTARDPLGRELLEDLHASFFKLEPKLDDAPPKGLAKHHELMKATMDTKEWANLHEQTKLDEGRAALATIEFGKQLKDKVVPPDPDEKRRLMRRLMKATEEAVEGAVEALGALTGGGNGIKEGTVSLSDLADAQKASRLLAHSTKIRRFVEQAGRLRRIAFAKHRARVRHGPDEVVDVELGDDLRRVVPSELALLGHPVLSLEFCRRFVERQLVQVRMEGTEPLGRGPIVVCVDTSGSMDGERTGREFWAKGMALACMSLAIDEERDFALINFSGPGQLRKWQFTGKPSLDLIVSALEHSFNGGTCFETPLREALETCKKSKFRNADVIFLTDGEAAVSQEFLASFQADKRAIGMRVFSVLIGFNSQTLRPISDGIERVDNLADDEAVTDLVFGGI